MRAAHIPFFLVFAGAMGVLGGLLLLSGGTLATVAGWTLVVVAAATLIAAFRTRPVTSSTRSP